MDNMGPGIYILGGLSLPPLYFIASKIVNKIRGKELPREKLALGISALEVLLLTSSIIIAKPQNKPYEDKPVKEYIQQITFD